MYKNHDEVPERIKKLLNNGRWVAITKYFDNSDKPYIVGIRRKSNGQERWLDLNWKQFREWEKL